MKIPMLLITMLLLFNFSNMVAVEETTDTLSISFKGDNPNNPPVIVQPPQENNHSENTNNFGKLPQTGETSSTYLFILGTLLIVIAISVNHIVNQKKGEKQYYEKTNTCSSNVTFINNFRGSCSGSC